MLEQMKTEQQIKDKYEETRAVILTALQSYEQDLGVKVDGDVHLYRAGDKIDRVGFTPNFPTTE